MPSICVGVPHTPWVVERAARLAELRPILSKADSYIELTERLSNQEWPERLYAKALASGCDYYVTVQDDVWLAPYFLAALRAMLVAVPRQVIGLAAVHPAGPEQARQGHRWYRTRAWSVGWGWAMPMQDLREHVAWRHRNPQLVASRSEDDLVNLWCTKTDRDIWHPCPSIIDHDVSLDSTYANDSHAHRRTTVTWRAYAEADLVDAQFWATGPGPQLLQVPAAQHCWACGVRPAFVRTPTGFAVCPVCTGQFVQQALKAVSAP